LGKRQTLDGSDILSALASVFVLKNYPYSFACTKTDVVKLKNGNLMIEDEHYIVSNLDRDGLYDALKYS